jgi:diphosphomevalonate decarboxylase
MPPWTAIGISCPNIAFIKYWGNRDDALRVPANGSISMNLDGLYARTRVTFDTGLQADEFTLGGRMQQGASLERVRIFLDRVRRMAGLAWQARVESENNFPTGTGIASSAAAFAALSLAASRAAGLDLDEQSLSRLARTGSGSACRSVPGGFVEWQAGTGDLDSYAFSIAPQQHWNLVDCVAIVSREHKPTGSSQGHTLAGTSPLQAARVADAPRRLDVCRSAILGRDFDALARVVELDSNLMHAVMMTSTPPLLYWLPGTMAILQAVPQWRKAGLPVCYTIDAGPNVHAITTAEYQEQVTQRLRQIPGVSSVLTATPGPAACAPE